MYAKEVDLEVWVSSEGGCWGKGDPMHGRTNSRGVLIRSSIKGAQDGVRVGSANKRSCWSTGNARPGRTNNGGTGE